IMQKQFKEEFEAIMDYYLKERGRRPMSQNEALDICKNAYHSVDLKTIDWIRGMGSDACHRLRNIGSHLAGKRFGFDLNRVGKYGWLEHPDFLGVEEIAFKLPVELYMYNHIEVGHGPNM